jgi:hypothetical protein
VLPAGSLLDRRGRVRGQIAVARADVADRERARDEAAGRQQIAKEARAGPPPRGAAPPEPSATLSGPTRYIPMRPGPKAFKTGNKAAANGITDERDDDRHGELGPPRR